MKGGLFIDQGFPHHREFLCQVWLTAPPTAWLQISLGSGHLKQLKLTAMPAMISRMTKAVSTVKTSAVTDYKKSARSEIVSPVS